MAVAALATAPPSFRWSLAPWANPRHCHFGLSAAIGAALSYSRHRQSQNETDIFNIFDGFPVPTSQPQFLPLDLKGFQNL